MKAAPIALFFALLAPLTASALEFRVLSWQGVLPGLKFQDGREEIAVSAQEHALSRRYRKTDLSTPLQLYREVLVEGKITRQIVAALTPPAGMASAILLLAASRDATAGEGYVGQWIEDSAAASPAGTIRFYNTASRPLALQVAGQQWLQAPGETRRLPFAADARTLQIRVAAEIDGAWQQVGNCSQPVRPQHRVLVLLRDGRPSAHLPAEPVELLAFYDTPAPAR